MKHRTDEEYKKLDMKTELQWAKLNKLPNDNVSGIALWCNPWHQNWSVYYNADEVHEADGEELEKFFQPYKEREKKRRKRTKEKQQRLWEKELENSYKRGEEEAREYYEKEIFKMKKNLKENFYNIFMNLEQKGQESKFINPKSSYDGVICFDVETTGLDPDIDEILQISVINGKGEELINTYVKPYYTVEWKEAERINGITKEMVANAPYAYELIDDLKELFSTANTWIAYNGQLDLNFLKHLGIQVNENVEIVDVMYDFAPLYGEWSEYYDCYKWQKLSTCASFFSYEYNAHDSLEDVKATLHCYNCMKKMMNDGTYQEIIERNDNISDLFKRH